VGAWGVGAWGVGSCEEGELPPLGAGATSPNISLAHRQHSTAVRNHPHDQPKHEPSPRCKRAPSRGCLLMQQWRGRQSKPAAHFRTWVPMATRRFGSGRTAPSRERLRWSTRTSTRTNQQPPAATQRKKVQPLALAQPCMQVLKPQPVPVQSSQQETRFGTKCRCGLSHHRLVHVARPLLHVRPSASGGCCTVLGWLTLLCVLACVWGLLHCPWLAHPLCLLAYFWLRHLACFWLRHLARVFAWFRTCSVGSGSLAQQLCRCTFVPTPDQEPC
jgi:hypothetical protein